MYGLADDFDPRFFVGTSLRSVCFSANTVSLSFDDEIRVTIESSFLYEGPPGGDVADRMTVPVAESRLMQLVEKKVIAAGVIRPGTLVLRFEDGQKLHIFDDSEQYESYRIGLPDSRELVV